MAWKSKPRLAEKIGLGSKHTNGNVLIPNLVCRQIPPCTVFYLKKGVGLSGVAPNITTVSRFAF